MQPNGQIERYPTKTVYIPLDYYWITGPEQRSVWADVIDKLPQIANGWDAKDMETMKGFLGGWTMIIGGRLRLMPPPAEYMKVNATVRTTASLLAAAEIHIQAGRIPLLKDETKQSLLARAEQFEIMKYGRPLAPSTQKESPTTTQRTLF